MTKVPAVLGITQRGSGSAPDQTHMPRRRDKALSDLHTILTSLTVCFFLLIINNIFFILSKFCYMVISVGSGPTLVSLLGVEST